LQARERRGLRGLLERLPLDVIDVTVAGAVQNALENAAAVAAEQGMSLQQGVYTWLSGPNFETPAEIRMLRMLGTDAVGMSTVPEAIVAHHAGMEVLALSTITNVCIDGLDADNEPTHEKVNAAGKIIVPRLTQLLIGVLGKLAAE
jgi:purine-nucleoside phosphorylase